jgi:arylformamidase
MVDWFNPRQAVPDSEQMMERFERASVAFRQSWPHQSLNHHYGPGERQTYDVFMPPQDQPPKGTVLFVHGGFWFSRHKDQFSFMAQAYAQAGWTFVAMTYPLMPDLSLSELVDQTAAGLVSIDQQLQDRYGQRIDVLAGHSAGAHLLAMAFHSPAGRHHTDHLPGLPKRLVLVSGVYDPQARAAAEISKTIGLTAEDAAQACPLTHCQPIDIPTFIFAGAREPDLWWQQGQRYRDRLVQEGLGDVHHELLAGHDHFSLLEAMANPASEIASIIMGAAGYYE